MSVLNLKQRLANYLWLSTVKRHHSRMGWKLAPKYSKYLRLARAVYKGEEQEENDVKKCVQDFQTLGFASYWDSSNEKLANAMLAKILKEERDFGDEEVWDKEYRYARGDIFKTFPELEEMFRGKMGAVIRSIFGSHFKIFYGVLYKSVRIGNEPQGSALWHSDSGPGTCVNIMFCLNTTDRSNGAMEFVPWDVSLSLFSSERAAMRDLVTNGQRDRLEIRKSMCDYYDARINQDFSDRITCLNGSPGLLLAFRNNVVHRGGFPEDGKVRYACVFHLYPSISQAPLDTYRANGVRKNGPFPTDPAF